MAITELKGRPVLLTPSFSRAASAPSAWQTRAKTNGLDTLWIENVVVVSPTSVIRPWMPAMQAPNASGGAAASAGM